MHSSQSMVWGVRWLFSFIVWHSKHTIKVLRIQAKNIIQQSEEMGWIIFIADKLLINEFSHDFTSFKLALADVLQFYQFGELLTFFQVEHFLFNAKLSNWKTINFLKPFILTASNFQKLNIDLLCTEQERIFSSWKRANFYW